VFDHFLPNASFYRLLVLKYLIHYLLKLCLKYSLILFLDVVADQTLDCFLYMLYDAPELFVNLVLKNFAKQKNLNVVIKLVYRLRDCTVHVQAYLLEPVSLIQINLQMLSHGLMATTLSITLVVVFLLTQHNLCNSFFKLFEGQFLLILNLF